MAAIDIGTAVVAGNAIVASDMNARFTGLATWANGSPNIGSTGNPLTVEGALTVTQAITASSTSQFNGTVTVGGDGTGKDVTFYSDTAGDHFVWDSSAEKLTITGTDGNTALDIADGNVEIDGTVTVGVDDLGHDVKFFGATATNGYMLWDESTDDLILGSASKLGIGDTTPDAMLDVHGQVIFGAGDDITPDANGNGHIMINGNGYGGFVSLDGSAMWVGNNSNGRSLYLATDETARLTVGGTGLVGIGIGPTGTAKLSVHGGLRFTATASAADIYTGLGATGSDILGICTGGTERIRVQATTHTADVFVGQTSTYSIGGSSDGNTFVNSASTKATYFRINNSSEMVLNATGLAINRGDSGPNNTLDVIGDLFVGDTSRTYAGNAQYGGLCFPRGEIFFSNTNTQNQLFLLSNMTMGGDGGLDAINTAVCAYAALDNGTFLVKTAASTTAGAAPSLTTRLIISNAGAVTIAGALSKGSGTFDIPHPTRGGDWRLRHSFIEGPQADLIYRGTATLSGGTVTIDLDTASNMTDGTWEALNRDPWAMVASSGNAVEWSLSGKTLTITSDTADAVCSWMVIGERQDDHMKSAEGVLADDDGHLIVEYEREDTSEADEAAAFEAGEALAQANAEAAAAEAAALAQANAEAAAVVA